jgi:hypothetical protein
MDDKNPATAEQNDPHAEAYIRKTDNSTPTVYPSVEYVNRTEP